MGDYCQSSKSFEDSIECDLNEVYQEPYVGMFEEFEEVVEAITMDEERPPILE